MLKNFSAPCSSFSQNSFSC